MTARPQSSRPRQNACYSLPAEAASFTDPALDAYPEPVDPGSLQRGNHPVECEISVWFAGYGPGEIGQKPARAKKGEFRMNPMSTPAEVLRKEKDFTSHIVLRQMGEREPSIFDREAEIHMHLLSGLYQFYLTAFNHRGLDGANGNITSHLMWSSDGQDHNNASMQGDRGNQLFFGAGSGRNVNVGTVIDIVGHEATHAGPAPLATMSSDHTDSSTVIAHTSTLVYEDETGALNESLADCFGIMFKHWRLNQTDHATRDWLLGNGWLGRKGGLRSFADPSLYGQPWHYDGFEDMTEDDGGVHTNSGIANYAFYLVCQAVEGPSWKIPGQIWYDAMVDDDLGEDADFERFARLTVCHASWDVERRVLLAWVRVGVLELEQH